MTWILLFGSLIAIFNLVLTYQELIPFFRATKQLSEYTKSGTWSDRMLYPFRYITLLPKLKPLILDVTIALCAGGIGLGGGVYGALISLTLGFTASLLIKIHRHFVAPKLHVQKASWKTI